MLKHLPSAYCAAAFLLLIASPVSAQPRCSERHFSATGAPGRIHFTGRRNARLAWSAKVRAELGAAYTNWGRATSRNFDCTFRDWHYHCSAAARPCRSFVSGR